VLLLSWKRRFDWSTPLWRELDSPLLTAGEVWIPAGRLPHCFGIADPIIRLSFSPDSHPIVGRTWPSQLLTRGLRMSTCCCNRPTKLTPYSLPHTSLSWNQFHRMPWRRWPIFRFSVGRFVTAKIWRVELYNLH